MNFRLARNQRESQVRNQLHLSAVMSHNESHPQPAAMTLYLHLVLIHRLEAGKEECGRTCRVADRLHKARDGNDRHVLIQRTGTGGPQLHPDVLGNRRLRGDHSREMGAGVGQLLAAATLQIGSRILYRGTGFISLLATKSFPSVQLLTMPLFSLQIVSWETTSWWLLRSLPDSCRCECDAGSKRLL